MSKSRVGKTLQVKHWSEFCSFYSYYAHLDARHATNLILEYMDCFAKLQHAPIHDFILVRKNAFHYSNRKSPFDTGFSHTGM